MFSLQLGRTCTFLGPAAMKISNINWNFVALTTKLCYRTKAWEQKMTSLDQKALYSWLTLCWIFACMALFSLTMFEQWYPVMICQPFSRKVASSSIVVGHVNWLQSFLISNPGLELWKLGAGCSCCCGFGWSQDCPWENTWGWAMGLDHGNKHVFLIEKHIWFHPFLIRWPKVWWITLRSSNRSLDSNQFCDGIHFLQNNI